MMNDNIQIDLLSKIVPLFFDEMMFGVADAPNILHSTILELRTHYKIELGKGVFDSKERLIVGYGLFEHNRHLFNGKRRFQVIPHQKSKRREPLVHKFLLA